MHIFNTGCNLRVFFQKIKSASIHAENDARFFIVSAMNLKFFANNLKFAS